MIIVSILLVPFLVMILLALVVVSASAGLGSGSSGSYNGQAYADLEIPGLGETDLGEESAGYGSDARQLNPSGGMLTSHAPAAFPAQGSQLDFELSSLNIITL